MTEALSNAELRAAIEDTLQQSALHLDERQFGAWIDGTAPEFRYRITAYSPELRRDMTWLEHDREGMVALIELLPKHHGSGATWLRQVVLGQVKRTATDAVQVTSTLSVFQTLLDVGDAHVDGGSSQLFLVGRYHDRFRHSSGRWLLVERTVRLHTRQLGVGSHLFP